jgi:hypothetical protein
MLEEKDDQPVSNEGLPHGTGANNGEGGQASFQSNKIPSESGASSEPGERKPVIVTRKSIYHRTRNWAVSIVAVLLFLVICAAVFTQLPIFRWMIVHELVKTVEASTNGTLVIGNIRGDIWNGFVLNDVDLRLKTGTRYDSVTIIHADKILATYSIVRWLRTDQLGITSMVIEKPKINLVKFVGDTAWNYTLLFKPVVGQPNPQPFNQIVDLKYFQIQNGSLTLRDYNQPALPITSAPIGRAGDTIHFGNAQLQDIELDGRLYAKGQWAQYVNVSHINFSELRSGFTISHLQFTGYHDSLQMRMDNAQIVTGRSALSFALEVSPPSIAKTGLMSSMKNSNVYLNLQGPSISTYELKQFLPNSLYFLNGTPGITLVTHGQFGKLHVDTLDLDFKGLGGVAIAGDLTHLDQPRDLFMDLRLRAEGLSDRTIQHYVPGLGIPDISSYGVVQIPHLTYLGEPVNFKTAFAIQTSGAGNATGSGSLDLRGPMMKYSADIVSQRLNLAAIMHDAALESNINAHVSAEGVGAHWRTLTSKLAVRATGPSSLGKYEFQTLDLAGSMQRGVATIDHLDADLAGGPVAHIKHGRIDLVAKSLPFQVDGTVNNVQLAQFVPSFKGNPARIDVTADLTGTARDLTSVVGTAHARLYDLVYQGRHFQDVLANITLAPSREGQNKIELASNIIDLTIDRRFTLRDLVHTVPDHLSALAAAISHRYMPQGTATPIINSCSDSIDFDYYVRLKDLRPLAGFIPKTFLLANGAVSGSVFGCPNGDISLIMEADSLGLILRNRDTLADLAHPGLAQANAISQSIGINNPAITSRPTLLSDTVRRVLDSTLTPDSLHSPLALPTFGSGVPRVHLTPTTFRLEARNIPLDPHQVLAHLDATLDFESDSVVRLGSALLYHPRVNLVYQKQQLAFDVATVYNDLLGFRLKGSSTFPEGEFDFALDTLLVAYFNRTPGAQLAEYRWFNEGPTHLRILESGGFALDTLTLVHPTTRGYDFNNAFAQRITLGGSLIGDSINGWLHVPSFDLKDIPKLFPFRSNSKTLRFAEFDGTVRKLDVNLHGTLERPDIALVANVDGLKYEGMTFDSTRVDLEYRNQALRGSILLHVDTANVAPLISDLPFNVVLTSSNQFEAVIDSIPMLIAFKHGPNYAADSAAILKRPLSAHVDATHFPIDIATPFIPAFTTLHGIADIHFAISGTQEKIKYGGYANVPDGSFQFTANNMYYTFSGKVTFDENSLILSNIAIKNVPADDPYGEAMVNGHFDFKGFSIQYFDLALRTDRLMVLSNASRATLKSIYGPVTIGTEGDDLHFQGTLQAPWIGGPQKSIGKISILSAHLTLPQSDNAVEPVSASGVIYRFLPNDSMIVAQTQDSIRIHNAREALDEALNSGSVQMFAADDTLFSNRMKDIYLNENGQLQDSTTQTLATGATPVNKPSFASLLRYDLQLRVNGDSWVTIPFSGVFGILGAQVAAELRTDEPIFVHRGDEPTTTVTGDLTLTPSSYFRFYQTFNIINGKIAFRQNFDNPEIDITAEYIGTHTTQDGQDQDVKIDLHITGTKAQPNLLATIYRRDASSGSFSFWEDGTPALEDVTYYLLTGGSFKSDLSEQAQMQVLSRAASSLGSQFFNTLLSNMFGSSTATNFIKSASLKFGSSVGVQLTAGWRNVTIRANINQATDPVHADYTIDVPLSTLTNFPTSRNILLQFQIHNQTSVGSAGALAEQPTFLSKLLYRIPLP